MQSKRRHEGYLLLDNRGGPGLDESAVHAAGLPAGAGRGMFEAPTITCSHCQVVVVLNPLRNRERAYCPKCDHYICDKCGAIRAANGGECRPFKQLIEEAQEKAARQEQSGAIILST